MPTLLTHVHGYLSCLPIFRVVTRLCNVIRPGAVQLILPNHNSNTNWNKFAYSFANGWGEQFINPVLRICHLNDSCGHSRVPLADHHLSTEHSLKTGTLVCINQVLVRVSRESLWAHARAFCVISLRLLNVLNYWSIFLSLLIFKISNCQLVCGPHEE
jgi:hypothetical protein